MSMTKKNIFNLLYKYSPLNFYTNIDNHTIIKSTHNPSVGYSFAREFTTEEILAVWKEMFLVIPTLSAHLDFTKEFQRFV